MNKKNPVAQQRESQEDLPEVTPEARSQMAVRESMDVDPATGAQVHLGVPERDDMAEVQDFLAWLQSSADQEQVDTVARIAENLRRASTAESIADLLREKRTVSGKDHVGIPFVATGFVIHEGEFEEEELPYFASLDAIDPRTGEEYIVNCGGEKILVYLRWMAANAEWPLHMCFTGKQTRKGRTILSFDILNPPQR